MSNVIEMILVAEELPSPPGVALRLLELYGQPSVEVKDMADAISTDPVLTAKVIEYCNSPLLARTSTTSSVNQAIVVMGMRAVKILALSFSLVRVNKSNNSSFDYEQFWNQSLATAVVAQTIGAARGGEGSDEFLLGLMLKIGQVGLAHTFPAKYAELQQQADETEVDITTLEEQEWELNQYKVGVELLRQWNFPKEIVAGLDEFGANQVHDGPTSERTRILSLAQEIVSLLFTSNLEEHKVERAKQMAMAWFAIDQDVFAELFDAANHTWSEYAVLLRFDASQAQTFEQLERRALKGIAQLSMGLHAENTAINQENEKLKICAMVDSLTGLRNRRSYDEESLAEWERSNRMQLSLAMMMVDIDHFKTFNDTYGHATGDEVLKGVAAVLRNNARQYDSVYRFGGEEFVVMVPECTYDSATTTAERYRKAIEDLEITINGESLKVTASIGVAIRTPVPTGDLDSLLADADRLLYEAKAKGRNQVCCDCKSTVIPPASIQVPTSSNESQPL